MVANNYTETVTMLGNTDTSLGDGDLDNQDKSGQIQTVFAVIGGCGCPGNILVIWVIINSKRMRSKPFNILITHQAFIDLLVGMNDPRLKCNEVVAGWAYIW